MGHFEDKDGYSQMCFSDEAQDELQMSKKERQEVCRLLFGMGVTLPHSARTKHGRDNATKSNQRKGDR